MQRPRQPRQPEQPERSGQPKKPLFRRSKTTKRDVVIFLLSALGVTVIVVLVANLIEHYT